MSGIVQTFVGPVFGQAGVLAEASAASVLEDPVVAEALAGEDPAKIREALARFQWSTNGMGTNHLAERVTPEMLAALRGRSPSAAHVFAAAATGVENRKATPVENPERMEVVTIAGGVRQGCFGYF